MPITEPGIYAVSDAEYLADPVIEPSLNNTIAKLLIDTSPSHAYAAHPKLGGAGDAEAEDDSDERQRIGSAAHAMFLRGSQVAKLIPFDRYQSNAAKAARDEAIAAGLIPLKPKSHDKAMRVVEALERFRASTDAFSDGKPEQTLVWREDDTWCRSKVDWLPDDPAAPLWDLKTTSGNASPRSWTRTAFELGADMQAAFYARGSENLRGEPPEGMLFCVVETELPCGIRVFGFSRLALDIAEDKLRVALDTWDQCRRHGEWPSYPLNTCWIDPLPWITRDWEEERYRRQQPERRGLQPISTATQAVVARMIQTGNLAG